MRNPSSKLVICSGVVQKPPLLSPDLTLNAWRIATSSSRIELTRRRREKVRHGPHILIRRRLYLYASLFDGRNTPPCWNVNRWSRAPGITISKKAVSLGSFVSVLPFWCALCSSG